MTILEFKTTNPSDYGVGNINLLYSSSISTGSYELPSNRYGASGSFAYDREENGVGTGPNYKEYYLAGAFFPPYVIIGLTIPFLSENNVQLEQTLSAVTKIKFTIGGESVTTPVINISKQNQYYYLETTPTTVSSLPSTNDTEGTPIDFQVEFVFLPYLQAKFDNSDFNALQGNATSILQSSVALEVDRDTDSVNPSNLGAIITKTATAAQVQYSNYTTLGWTNARYEGSLNTATIERDDPAQSYRSFKGVINPLDADNATILAAGADQNAKTLYFNIEAPPLRHIITSSLGTDEMVRTGKYEIAGTFPTVQSSDYSGSIIYESQGNNFVRVVDKKVHAVDQGTIYVTSELGVAITGSTA